MLVVFVEGVIATLHLSLCLIFGTHRQFVKANLPKFRQRLSGVDITVVDGYGYTAMGGTKKRQLNVWLLRKLCEDRGLTQTELAERSGVDMGHISRIIKGKVRQPGEDIVIAMARAMGVTDPEVLWDTVPAFDLTQTQAKALLLLRELTEEQQDIVLRLAASLARTGH